jgi:hypothetical protein
MNIWSALTPRHVRRRRMAHRSMRHGAASEYKNHAFWRFTLLFMAAWFLLPK